MKALVKVLAILGVIMIISGIVIDLMQRHCYNLPLNEYFNNSICRFINER